MTITEKGSAVQQFRVEYKDAESGQWKEFGSGTQIENGVISCDQAASVTAAGIRITVSESEGLPAIYEVEMIAVQPDENAEHTVTVNDNTMGEGLFRFDYDDLWSYRETETNASAGAGTIYPLENDGHFSNFSGAEATFTFYGEKVELLLRANQAAAIRAGIADENGEVTQWTNGVNGQRSITFADLEPGVHTLKIQKLSASQAGIDGAAVTYTGEIPESVTEEYNAGPRAVQTYLNQRVTDSSAQDYFTYDPAASSVNMPSDDRNTHFGVYEEEQNGWIEHVQDGVYHNLGFTRTNKDGAGYTIQFYGTGVQLYSSAVPVDNSSEGYGELTFELDGEEVEAAYSNTDQGTNGKISLRMVEINVEGADKNEVHTLKVTVNSGYNRIDYAVVNRFAESGGAAGEYAVTVSGNGNGTVELLTGQTVSTGGNASVQITPDQGYGICDLVVNDKTWTAPVDGRLVLTNIREDVNIQINFDLAVYSIGLPEGEGGVIIPSALKSAAGKQITLTADAFDGYELKEGSLTVTSGGKKVELVSGEEENTCLFTMPEGM